MKARHGWIAAVLVVGLCIGTWGQGQQGAEQNQRAAQQPAAQPEMVSLTGTVQAIEEYDRPRAAGVVGQGVHLVLATEQEEELNVHLGPQTAVNDMIEGLAIGQEVTVEAFRYDQLPENQYVARSLAWDGNEVVLRDANLRPVWAGQNAGQGRRGRRMEPGQRGGPRANDDWGMTRQQMQQRMQDWLEKVEEASQRLEQKTQAMNAAEGDARVQAIADVVNELVDQHQAVMEHHQRMMEQMMERRRDGMKPGMRGGPQTQPQDAPDQAE